MFVDNNNQNKRFKMNSENETKSAGVDKYSVESALVFIPIWLIAFAIILLGFEEDIQNSLKWSFITTCVIYFGVLFKHLWVNPDANHALILENPLKPLRNPKTETEMTQQKMMPANQRPVMAGWHGKRIWEKPIAPPIFLGRAELVNETVTVQDSEGVPFIIPYQFPMMPLGGKWLPLHNLANAKPEIAKGAFNKRIQEKMQTEFKKHKGDDIIADPVPFRKEIGNVFGGPDKIDDYEIENGFYTRSVDVGAIQLHPDVQKARQAKALNKLRSESNEAIRIQLEKPNGALAAKIALAYEGDGDVSFVEIGGLEGLSSFHFGGLEGGVKKTGKKSNPKGEKQNGSQN